MPSAKIELTLEQIAVALRGLRNDEIETLEVLLNKKTKNEILKRSKEAKKGKTIKFEQLKAYNYFKK